MSEEPTDTPTLDRCPECRARVRPGQDWCTLCNAVLSSPSGASLDASPDALPSGGDATSGSPLGLEDAAAPDDPAPPGFEEPRHAADEESAADQESGWPAVPESWLPSGQPSAAAKPHDAVAAPEPGEIDMLLARLSASESGVTGPIAALTPRSGPVARVAIACGAGLVVTGLLLGGLALFGSLV